MSRIIRAITSCFILLCIIQALYWPIPKPGTSYDWWQVGILAKVGYVVGLPVLFVIIRTPLTGMAQTSLGWGLSIIWATAIYLALGLIVTAFSKKRRHSA
jgi:hypothetical protein